MIKKRFQKIVFGVVFVSMQVPVFAAADTGGFITRTIWFSPESSLTSRENISSIFLESVAGDRDSVVAGAAFFLSS